MIAPLPPTPGPEALASDPNLKGIDRTVVVAQAGGARHGTKLLRQRINCVRAVQAVLAVQVLLQGVLISRLLGGDRCRCGSAFLMHLDQLEQFLLVFAGGELSGTEAIDLATIGIMAEHWNL